MSPKKVLPFLFTWLLACQRPGNQVFNEGKTRIRIDGQGREVQIPGHIRRVLALSPALTEMLFSIGEDSLVVGVSHQCNYPPEKVRTRPVVNTYPLDIEKLISLKPDLVLTETGISAPADLAQMQKAGISVYCFSYQKVADILAAIDSLMAWLPTKPGAKTLFDSLQQKYNQLEKWNQKLKEGERPKILAITWFDPIFAYGFNTWMTDKMRLAGGKNALSEALDKPYPQIQRELILKLNPDILLGSDFKKMDSTFFRLYPELKGINAYKRKSIFGLNDDLATRPGPRFLEGISEIRQKVEATKGMEPKPTF
jgi:iron complex transport system substrate-binding protein